MRDFVRSSYRWLDKYMPFLSKFETVPEGRRSGVLDFIIRYFFVLSHEQRFIVQDFHRFQRDVDDFDGRWANAIEVNTGMSEYRDKFALSEPITEKRAKSLRVSALVALGFTWASMNCTGNGNEADERYKLVCKLLAEYVGAGKDRALLDFFQESFSEMASQLGQRMDVDSLSVLRQALIELQQKDAGGLATFLRYLGSVEEDLKLRSEREEKAIEEYTAASQHAEELEAQSRLVSNRAIQIGNDLVSTNTELGTSVQQLLVSAIDPDIDPAPAVNDVIGKIEEVAKADILFGALSNQLSTLERRVGTAHTPEPVVVKEQIVVEVPKPVFDVNLALNEVQSRHADVVKRLAIKRAALSSATDNKLLLEIELAEFDSAKLALDEQLKSLYQQVAAAAAEQDLEGIQQATAEVSASRAQQQDAAAEIQARKSRQAELDHMVESLSADEIRLAGAQAKLKAIEEVVGQLATVLNGDFQQLSLDDWLDRLGEMPKPEVLATSAVNECSSVKFKRRLSRLSPKAVYARKSLDMSISRALTESEPRERFKAQEEAFRRNAWNCYSALEWISKDHDNVIDELSDLMAAFVGADDLQMRRNMTAFVRGFLGGLGRLGLVDGNNRFQPQNLTEEVVAELEANNNIWIGLTH